MESERRGKRRGNRRWGGVGRRSEGWVALRGQGGRRRVAQEEEAKRDAAWMRCGVDAVGGLGGRRREMRERGGAMQERGVDARGPVEQRDAGEERRGAMRERRWGWRVAMRERRGEERCGRGGGAGV
uniref:Uncharacterized protein n=1 Tax=Oryza sativa subsp. japonica TaxID=39947 RepID=Q656C9_ORYSJ|nr:hypothetical protein [Oryza sativa Japonica Group]